MIHISGILVFLFFICIASIVFISHFAILEIKEKRNDLYKILAKGAKHFPETDYGKMDFDTAIRLYKFMINPTDSSVIPIHIKTVKILFILAIFFILAALSIPFAFEANDDRTLTDKVMHQYYNDSKSYISDKNSSKEKIYSLKEILSTKYK